MWQVSPEAFGGNPKPAGLKESRCVKQGPGKGGRSGEAHTGGSCSNEGCGGDTETRATEMPGWKTKSVRSWWRHLGYS